MDGRDGQLRSRYQGRRTGSIALADASLFGPQALQRQRPLQGYRSTSTATTLFPTQSTTKRNGRLAAQAAKDVIEPEPLLVWSAPTARTPTPAFNTLFTSVGSGTGGATEKIYTRIASGYQWRVVTTPPSVGAYTSLRRLRRNPETGRRVRHGQRPLPHHGLHRTATRRGRSSTPTQVTAKAGFSTFKHPIYGDELRDAFKMYQNREPRFYVNVFWSGMTWHGANEKNSQRPVLLRRQFGLRENRTTITRRVIWRTSSPNRVDRQPPPANYGYLDFARSFRYAEILLNYVEALNEYDPVESRTSRYLPEHDPQTRRRSRHRGGLSRRRRRPDAGCAN